MSILIAYIDNDQSKRVHINDYDHKLHKDKIFCAHGHAVIGKQGNKMTWHYAHVNATDSDCSREMGEWHHWWQGRVFTDFLEIIIERDEGKLHIKHIADMINGNNVVVEFQKSVVPDKIISERERFYDNMIWVFCCVDHQIEIIKQHGRYMKVQLIRGSKYFVEAKKTSFLDFDKKGVLELLKIKNATKVKPDLYVKIWTLAEFDERYMKGCLKPDADKRVYRQPYQLESNDVPKPNDNNNVNKREESLEEIFKILDTKFALF